MMPMAAILKIRSISMLNKDNYQRSTGAEAKGLIGAKPDVLVFLQVLQMPTTYSPDRVNGLDLPGHVKPTHPGSQKKNAFPCQFRQSRALLDRFIHATFDLRMELIVQLIGKNQEKLLKAPLRLPPRLSAEIRKRGQLVLELAGYMVQYGNQFSQTVFL